ncbi:MAG: tetratricopeptide repeat protein [Opitutaceae bacterium]
MPLSKFRAILLSSALLFGAHSFAAVELSEDSEKLYKLLRKRPDSEVILNRFYDQFLSEATLSDLETVLVESAAATGATANDIRLLASFYEMQGLESKALSILKRAVEGGASGAQLRLDQAQLEIALLEHSDALESLEAALKLDVDIDMEIELRRMLGTTLSQIGQIDRAQEVWQKLLADYPDERELMEDLIELQMSEGLLDAALETAKKLVEQTREPYQKALDELWVGDILQRKEESGTALKLYSDLLDKVGGGSWLERELLAKIEQVLFATNSGADAVDYYDELLKRYPHRIGIRQKRLHLLAQKGRVDEAIEAYQGILRLTPGNREQLEGYIQLLQSNDRLPDAIVELQKLSEAYPSDSELCLQLVELQSQIDDEAGLLKAIEAFARTLGDDPFERLRVARLYENSGFDEIAGEHFAKLAAEFADDFEIVESYAQWLHRNDQVEEAVGLWLSLSQSQDRDGLIRIAQSLGWVQEREEAYALLKRRVETFSTDILYLKELCQLAISLDLSAEALPWARTLVLKAETPLEVSGAVELASELVIRAKLLDVLIRELQAAAESGSISLQELCFLAELEESQGDSLASEKTLNRLRAIGGEVALSEEVRIFENRGQVNQAIDALNKLIELPKQKNAVNFGRLLSLLEREASYEAALAVIAEWKKVSPGDLQIWLRESELLESSDNLELAQRQLRKAIHKFGDEPELQLRLASLLRQAQQFAAAERIYWKLHDESESQEDQLRWMSELGAVARESGQTDEFVAKLESMNQANRQALTPLLALADFYKNIYDTNQSLTCLLEAARVAPENTTVLDQLVSAYQSMGDTTSAQETLNKLVSLENTDGNRRRLAQFMMRSGDSEGAYAVIKSSLLSGQPDAAGLESFVDMLMSNNEWELAEAEALKAYKLFPNDWRIGYQLVVCSIENFKEQAALELLFELRGKNYELKRFPKAAPAVAVQSASAFSGMPQVSREVMNLLGSASSVFRYHRNRSRTGSHRSSGMTGPFLYLPESLEGLHRVTSLQLGSLVSDMSRSEQAKAIEKMEALGVPYPQLIVHMQGARTQMAFWAQNMLEYLEDNPEEIELLPLALQYSRYQRNQPFPIESALLGFNSFADEYPLLRLQFAVKLLQNEKENYAEYLEVLLEGFESESVVIDSRYRTELLSILFSLFTKADTTWSHVDLSSEQSERIRRIALAEYEAQQGTDSSGANYRLYSDSFRALFLATLDAGDRTALISLLDGYMQNIAQEIGSSQSQSNILRTLGYRTHRTNQFELKVPDFSPIHVSLLHADLVRLFTPEELAQSVASDRVGKLRALDLGSVIDEIQHPRVRFLVAWHSNNEARCHEALQELCAVEAPQVPDLMALVAWEAKELGDPAAAMETVIKVRETATSTASREQLDRMLLALGLEMPLDELKASEKYAEVQSAALRLRVSAKRIRGGSGVLLSTMKALEMDEASQLFEAATQRLASGGSRLRFVGPTTTRARSSAQDPFSKMDSLVAEGKVDAAVDLAVRGLRPVLNQALQNRNALNSHTQRLKKMDITDEILARFDPGESNSRRMREYYALLLESVERRATAAQVWLQLHEQRPEIPRYALAAAFNGESVVSETILSKLLATRDYSDLDDELSAWMMQTVQSGSNLTVDQWLRLISIGEMLLSQIEPSGSQSVNITWAPYLAVQFGQRTNIKSKKYPNLVQHNRSFTLGKDPDGSLAKNVALRDEAYEALCRAMLRHPQTAEQGFMLLNSKYLIRGLVSVEDDNLITIAMEAALVSAREEPASSPAIRNARQMRWSLRTGSQNSYSNGVSREVSPLVYLIRNRAEVSDSSFDQFAQQLADIDSGDALVFNSAIELIDSDARDSFSLLEAWLARDMSSLEQELMFEAIELASVSEASLQLLLESAREQLAEMPISQDTGAELARRIGDLLWSKRELGLLEQWFHHCAEVYLGPKENWSSMVEQFDSKAQHSRDTPHYKLSRYWQFGNKLGMSPDLVIPLVRYTRDTGLGLSAGTMNSLRTHLQLGFEDIEAAMAWCEAQQLFADFEDFDPLIMLDQQTIQNRQASANSMNNRNSVVYERALREIKFRNDPKSEVRKGFIEALQERGFGGQILAAFLVGSNGDDAALAALDRNFEAYKALDEDDQYAIAFLYRYWLGKSKSRSDSPAFVHLQQVWSGGIEDVAREYLKVTTAVDRQNYNNESNQVRKWIAELIKDAPELCAELYGHWYERAEKFSITQNQYTPAQKLANNRRMVDYAFEQTRKSPSALFSLINYYTAIDTALGSSNGQLSVNAANNFGGIWSAYLKAELAAQKPSAQAILEYLPKHTAQIDAPQAQQFSAIGLYNFAMNHFSYNSKDIEELVKLFKANQESASLHERMFWAGALNRFARDGKWHAVAAESLANLIADEEISLNVRLNVWITALRKTSDPWLYDPVLVAPSSKLIAEYLDANYPIFDQDWSAVFSRLSTASESSEWHAAFRELLPKLLGALPPKVYQNDQGNAKKVVGSLIRIGLQIGDASTVRSIVNQHFWLVKGDARILYRLVLSGDVDTAQRIVADDGKFSSHSSMPYTAELHANLPNFLAKLLNPNIRNNLEIEFACLADSKDLKASEVPNRAKRAEALLATFKPASNPKVTTAHLNRLCQYADDKTLAVPHIEALLGGKGMAELLADNESSNAERRQLAREQLKLFRHLATLDLKENGSSAIQKHLNFSDQSLANGDVKKFIQELESELSRACLSDLENRTEAEWAAMLPAAHGLLDLMLRTDSSTFNNNRKTAYYVYLLSHIGGGSAEQIDTDFSEACMPELEKLKKRWNPPESMIRELRSWTSLKDEFTARRRAALSLLLSNHAKVESIWATSAKALQDAVRGSSGSDSADDLKEVLKIISSPAHPRFEWMNSIRGESMLNEEGSDVVELISIFAPTITNETTGQELRDYNYKFARRINEAIFDSWDEDRGGSKFEFALNQIAEIDAQLSSDREREFAAFVLYYFGHQDREFSKKPEIKLLEQGTNSVVFLQRIFTLGVLSRHFSHSKEINPNLERLLAEVAGNVELAFYLRFEVFRHLANRRYFSEKIPEIDGVLADLLIEYLENGRGLDDRDVVKCFQGAYQASSDPLVQEVYPQTQQAWVSALLDLEVDASERIFTDCATKVILLSLALSDVDSASALLGKFDSKYIATIDLFLWLIRHAEFELADDLLERRDLLSNRQYSFGYDDAVHQNFSAFLDRTQDPVKRYRLSVMVQSLRDSSKYPPTGTTPSRDVRLQDLLSDYTPHRNDPNADVILDLITDTEATAFAAKDEIAEVVGDFSVGSLIERNSREHPDQFLLSLLVKHLSNRSIEGDFELLKTELKHLVLALSQSSSNRDRLKRKLLSSRMSRLFDCLAANFLDYYAEGQTEHLDQWFEVAFICSGLSGRIERPGFRTESPDYETFLILAYNASVEMGGEHNLDLSELPGSRRNSSYPHWTNNFWESGGFNRSLDERTRQKRLVASLQLLLSNQSYLDERWTEGPYSLPVFNAFQSKGDRKLLPEVVSKVITAGHPHEPWLAYLIADYTYRPTSENKPEAIKWYKRAMSSALTREDNRRTTAGDSVLKLAALLQDSEAGKAEAIKLLRETPADAFTERAAEKAKEVLEILESGGQLED